MHALEFISFNVIQLLRAMQSVQSEIKPLETFLKAGKVTELNLRSQGLTIQDIENLCRVLKENKTVIALDLGLNRIGVEGALYLQALLEANTPLMTLNLERNPLCVAGAALLAQGLKKNTNLQTLNLRQTQMCSAGAQHLAAALCVNATLQKLDLGLNGISKASGAYLAETLKVNISLFSLNLEDNQLGCEGIKPLVESCMHNSVLTVLYLGGNQIKDKGADFLLQVVNSMIQQFLLRPFVVHLSQNDISQYKLFLLQKAFAQHKANMDRVAPIVQGHLPTAVASVVIDYLGLESSYSSSYSMNNQRGLKRVRA